MTTLPPRLISSSATLQHFYLVFRVSRLTRQYLDMQVCQKVDLPEAGLPTKITISFSTKSTAFPLPTTTSPAQGIVVGLKPFTSIASVSPKNKFSGVLNQIPAFSANLRSESEKSLCLASLRPAASPQKNDFALLIFTPALLFSKQCHILFPGLRYSSSWEAINTCISTPSSFAIFSTLVLMSDALVLPFSMPAWLVKITILQPSLQSSFTLGLTLSLRNNQSWASLGNLAPDLRVMIVSSMSKEATFSKPTMLADDPIRHVFSSNQLQPPTSLFAFAILPLNCRQICIKSLVIPHMQAHSNKIKGRAIRYIPLLPHSPLSSIQSRLNRVGITCIINMRDRQQFDDRQNSGKLDRLKIQAPVRSGSLFTRPERSQSASRKPSNEMSKPAVGRPLYEETYYISSIRQNYLTLISDNMEILQLPLGLIRQDIKVGHPIRLKLEYDSKRQQTDDNRFKTIQKDLYKEFHHSNNQ